MAPSLDTSMDIDYQYQSSHLDSHESNVFNIAKFNSDVYDAIEHYKDNELSTILYLVIKTFLGESPMGAAACRTYLREKRTTGLRLALETAYQSRNFVGILSHDAMIPQVIERASKLEAQGIPPSSSGGLQDLQLQVNSVQSVFRAPYIGDAAKLLIDTLNHERQMFLQRSTINKPYNWSISIVQSSGLGKSRMVEEAGKTVFTIPINIREEEELERDAIGPKFAELLLRKVSNSLVAEIVGVLAYPPPDSRIRLFFQERANDDDNIQQAHYMILLRKIFSLARRLVNTHFPGLTGATLALKWANYLAEGQTDRATGPNRQQFYNKAVDAAIAKISQSKSFDLAELEINLRTSCMRLTHRVQPTPDDTNACFVYFDEAHPLTRAIENPSDQHKRNQFHNLGMVLSKLINYKMFFIFLSTSSSLRGFAPPPTFFRSERMVVGSQLVIPFTELPFDIHEHLVAQEFNSPGMTLTRAYHVDVIVMFGRPLWYTMHQVNSQPDIFQYATDKLSADGMPGHEADSALAALGVRVGIVFADKEIVFDDKETPVDENHPYWVQSRLVQSHMRIAYSIPRRRGYIHTGTPSEPVLAEAAGRYLSQAGRGGIAIEAPARLSEALDKRILASNGRKELVARLLVTAAHDIALESRYGRLQHQPNLSSYHRPIRVLDFLCALFHRDHHSKVLNAECLTRREGVKTLSDAFWNSYVFFSHFALAGDSEMLSVPALATALVRGMALQARDGQEFIDAVIPIHMGSLKVPVSAKTTSAINLKIKSREGLSDCKIDRSITVPNANMPAISIVFELGITGQQSNTVEVSESCLDTGSKGADHVDDHHYEIVARGCSSKLFGPVTREMEPHYKTLLGAGSVWEDFARRDQRDNVEALRAMKPVANGKQQVANYFDQPEPTGNRQWERPGDLPISCGSLSR